MIANLLQPIIAIDNNSHTHAVTFPILSVNNRALPRSLGPEMQEITVQKCTVHISYENGPKDHFFHEISAASNIH